MADVVEISTASKEYVRAAVHAEELGLTVNPTAATVEMAFVQPLADPQAGDWKAAVWDTDSSDPAGTVYYAQCLVGPGGTVTLANGRYTVWVRVTRGTEQPARKAGTLIVT
jgi:hypothetical protein